MTCGHEGKEKRDAVQRTLHARLLLLNLETRSGKRYGKQGGLRGTPDTTSTVHGKRGRSSKTMKDPYGLGNLDIAQAYISGCAQQVAKSRRFCAGLAEKGAGA